MIEVTEAMTAADLHKACIDLAALLGGDAEATSFFTSKSYSNPATVSIYPHSMVRSSDSKHFHASTFPEAFAEARGWVKTHQVVYRNATIRRMALSIMEVTDEHGQCTDTLLRSKGFSAAEIVEHHEAACQRAGEMAAGAPFRVVMAGELV